MAANKTVLNNGIRILTRRIPHVRSVSMGVWVNVGARDESARESGLSHLIEHMIFKGTTRRTAFQIARAFDAIGGYTNAFTGMETTCYHARVTDTHLETMTDILSDIFLNSVFAPDEFERERPVILQEIEMVEDSPEDYIHMLSEAAYWGDHPLGRPIFGTRDNILNFDAAAIRAFFHRLYQPERIVISAAGNLDHDHFVGLMGDAFEAIRPGNGFPERTAHQGRSGVFPHPRDLGQAHICLETRGVSITDPRRYAASLLNTVLGGNMSSRIFQEIRERRGLAYSVYSFMSSYTDTGVSGVYVGTGPDNGAESVRLILRALRRLREMPVDADELRDAREYTKGNMMLASESVDNQMVRLARDEIHLGRYMPLDDIVSQVEAVTADDILRLAQELYRPDPLTLTILGPVTDAAPYAALLEEF